MSGGGIGLAQKKQILILDLARGKLMVDRRFFFGLGANNYQVTIPASDFQAIGIPITEDIVCRIDMSNYDFSVSIGYLF